MIILIIRKLIFSTFLCTFFANASTEVRQANAQELCEFAQVCFDTQEYEDALSLWEKALYLESQGSLPEDIHLNLAKTAFNLAQWEKVFGYYTLAFNKDGENMPADDIKNLALACMEMAVLDAADREFESAKQYNFLAKKYFELFLAKNTQPLNVILAVDISRVYYLTDDFEKSVQWHQATLELALRSNSMSQLSDTFYMSFSKSLSKQPL